MGHIDRNQINHAPALELDSADYLTDRKVIREYEKIRVQHLHRPSWLERMANVPTVRRMTREFIRLCLILLALSVCAILVYYLQLDASLAGGSN